MLSNGIFENASLFAFTDSNNNMPKDTPYSDDGQSFQGSSAIDGRHAWQKIPLTEEQAHIKKTKRLYFKETRKAVPPAVQRQKAEEMTQHVIKNPIFLRARKIAGYWPIEGEMDPRGILEIAWKRNKKCYLPALHPLATQRLFFLEYHPHDRLARNRFDILEPKLNPKSAIISWILDIVFVPLLAFDNKGHRLGRGAGFYDVTFSYLKHEVKPHPLLIGLGYEFQRETSLPHHAWDIKLSGVATEKGLTLF